MNDAEVWMIAITVTAAVIPWAFSMHAKVAVIAETVQKVPAMFDELKRTLEYHEARLDAHDAEITSLKNKAEARH